MAFISYQEFPGGWRWRPQGQLNRHKLCRGYLCISLMTRGSNAWHPRDACKMRGRSTGSGFVCQPLHWDVLDQHWLSVYTIIQSRSRSNVSFPKHNSMAEGRGRGAGRGHLYYGRELIARLDMGRHIGGRLPIPCSLTIQYNRSTWSTFGGENWVKSNLGKDA